VMFDDAIVDNVHLIYKLFSTVVDVFPFGLSDPNKGYNAPQFSCYPSNTYALPFSVTKIYGVFIYIIYIHRVSKQIVRNCFSQNFV